jgi:uncharacterized membrane protein
MTETDPNDEPTLLSARLVPYRSLDRRGFLAVMIAVGALSFAGGLVFVLMGAWPVVGFLGLDVALVYWAFRANYRAAAAFEDVTVTGSALTLRKVSADGASEIFSFNPLWTRLERETHPDYGVRALYLVSRGRRLPIGAFLAPEERESFAATLLAALAEAKRGPTRTML